MAVIGLLCRASISEHNCDLSTDSWIRYIGRTDKCCDCEKRVANSSNAMVDDTGCLHPQGARQRSHYDHRYTSTEYRDSTGFTANLRTFSSCTLPTISTTTAWTFRNDGRALHRPRTSQDSGGHYPIDVKSDRLLQWLVCNVGVESPRYVKP
jgi:hypothetical protein